MERLTTYSESGLPTIKEDGLRDTLPSEELLYRVVAKLAKYEDAEEQGRYIRLPCNVGDTVYRVVKGRCELRERDMCREYCDGYDFACNEYKERYEIQETHFARDIENLGKTVFLTSEEAEAKIFELRRGKNNDKS